MRVFVFLVSGLLKMDFFNESVCFFVWSLLKMDFSMRVFLFFVSGLFKIDFSMRVFVFWSQALWKTDPLCFFNESLCFLVPGLLKIFLNDSVSSLVSGIVEDGAVLFFKWIFIVFRARIVFQWASLFVWFQHYWKTIFNESVFLSQSELKVDFSMKVFLFFVSGLFKIDFSMRVFVSLASGIVEDGAVHFFTWICKFLKTRIVFLMRVFVFWFQAFPAVGNILVLVVAFSN